MSIVLDIIVVGIIAAVTVITAKKGFVKSLLSVASLVITLLIISSAAKPLTNYIYEDLIEKPIESGIEQKIAEQNNGAKATVENIWDGLPKLVTSLASKAGYNKDSISSVVGNAADPKETAGGITESVIRPPITSALLVVVDIVLFAVLMFVFRCISRAICKLFKAPVLNKANMLCGVVLGAVKGIAVAVAVCVLIASLADLSKNGQFIIFTKDAIEKSFLFKEFSTAFGLL